MIRILIGNRAHDRSRPEVRGEVVSVTPRAIFVRTADGTRQYISRKFAARCFGGDLEAARAAKAIKPRTLSDERRRRLAKQRAKGVTA